MPDVSCREFRNRLSAYHDGELDAADRDMVAAHLADCAACRAYLDEFGRLSSVLREGRQGQVSPGLWDRIAVAAQTARRRRRVPWALHVGAVAAGFGVFWAGYGLLAARIPTQQAGQAQVEQLLHDTALTLSGQALTEDVLVELDRRPELALLRELGEETAP
ncbi:MAG: anti-sigma factor [Phycisphaerae bacterium]|jgi:anti-sigma factor RsiW